MFESSCEAFDTSGWKVSITERPHVSPPRLSLLRWGYCVLQQGEPLSAQHTAHTAHTAALGVWKFLPPCSYSVFVETKHYAVLHAGFYCEHVNQRQSADAGVEMKTRSRGAGTLTDQGRESGSGLSSKTVITMLLWTLIWTCGSSLTLYYNSFVTLEAT